MAYGIDRTNLDRGVISYQQGNDDRVTGCSLTVEGACQGISVWWIIRQSGHKVGRAGSQDFWDWYENDPHAMQKVISVMQNQKDIMQKATSDFERTGRFAETSSGASAAAKKLRIFVSFILNNAGFNALRNGRGLIESNNAVAWSMLANDIVASSGFSLINFATPKQQLNFVGHAIAACLSNGRVDFMDPNIGEFRGVPAERFNEFLQALKMDERYGGTTVKYAMQTVVPTGGRLLPSANAVANDALYGLVGAHRVQRARRGRRGF
jgi:Yersinia/Haemophilus virulence surface antigen